jgi:hypothetical protein
VEGKVVLCCCSETAVVLYESSCIEYFLAHAQPTYQQNIYLLNPSLYQSLTSNRQTECQESRCVLTM